MRSTRALIASVGASIALVAAAALTLLTVSAVVALEGWPGLNDSKDQPALVVGDDQLADGGPPTSAKTPVVLRPPAERRRAATPAPRTRERAVRARQRPAQRRVAPVVRRPVRPSRPHPVSPPPPVSRPVVTPKAPPPTLQRQTGDTVKEVGDGLSGTLQGTGGALKKLTEPLSPVTAQTLQNLTNFLAGVVQRATGLLGGTVERLTGPPAAP